MLEHLHVALGLSLLGSLVAVGTACGPGTLGEGCCNSCGRNYRLEDSHGLGSARLIGGKGGNECEIESKSQIYPTGDHWIVGTIQGRDTREAGGETIYSYELDVTSTEPPETRPAECEDSHTFVTADALLESKRPDASKVCVRGEILLETICTQKGCIGF